MHLVKEYAPCLWEMQTTFFERTCKTKTFLQTRGKQWCTMNIASIIEDCEMHFWMAGESFCWQIVHSNCVCGHLLTVQFSTSFKPERLWDPRNWLLVGFDQIVLCPHCMYVPVLALKLVCVCVCWGRLLCICKSRLLCICKSRRLCICKNWRLRNQRGRASRS